ncbi:MAG: S24 family peptidase [Planctomycetota bacterium]|jgi:transcriptional regulator with XRE-family HTH domain
MRKQRDGFDENAIIERIKQMRAGLEKGRSKSKFARALGISPSTYSYYEKERVPPIDILLKISEVAPCDLNWLLTGRTPTEKPAFGPGRAVLERLGKLFAENPDLIGPLSAFVELLCEKQDLEKQLDRKPAASGRDRPGWIPVLGRTAAGLVHFWQQESLPKPEQAVTELDELVSRHLGKTVVGSVDTTVSIDLRARPLLEQMHNHAVNLIRVTGEDEEQIVEFVQCQPIHEIFPDSFALHIDGDSMSPRIDDGDIVILSPSVPAAQGHIAVAHLANQIGVTCKLIRTTETQVHLIPINERYEPKVVPKEDLVWALAVLGHITV